ncbi:MAG TPA: thiamine pyrophosphate-dependent dehydrogenase E1 component subunit alpha [Candidatus Nitrosotalea sp.]|nr:thiamine pyrophosphate-dependent dehydrogenase E1 component subunit alpha [Candidatus Nitrosotalea sp.]
MSAPPKEPKGTGPAGSLDRHSKLGLSSERLLWMYRQMLLARSVDRRMWLLNRQGKAPFVVSGRGHEAAQVGAAAAMRPGVDWLVPYYRDLAFCLALGVTAADFMLSVFARASDPSSGGRQMPSHFSNVEARIVSTSSVVGPKQLHACGIAYAAQLRGLDEVAVSCIGEGGTSEGDWHEAMNFASIHRLPFICLVQDNDYAISVPRRLQMAVADVAHRAKGYGMPGVSVDGGDVLEVYTAMRRAMERARSGQGPTLIAARVARFTSHSSDDDQRRYRPAEELEAMLALDPLERFGEYLTRQGLLTPEQDSTLKDDCHEEVEEATRRAEVAPSPEPSDIHRHLFQEG